MNKSKVIEVNNISKEYSNVKVVDNLSFSANEGDIIGLIGPNGAGKSTTIKIMLKLISKNQGEIKIKGVSIDQFSDKISREIGFTSESPSFYDYLSGYENLKLIERLYPRINASRTEELIEFVGLKDSAMRKVKTYSTGMKQRLGLARALINKPQIVILDEPTNGLDPQGMRDVYNLIFKLAKEERITFIISSHLLHDVERICNKVIIINQGKTIYNGDIKNIQNEQYSLYSITGIAEDEVESYFSKLDAVKIITRDIDSLTIQLQFGDISAVRDDLICHNIRFKEINQVTPTLEELFFLMTKEA